MSDRDYDSIAEQEFAEYKRDEVAAELKRLMAEHSEKCRGAIEQLYQHWLDAGYTIEQLKGMRVVSDLSPDGSKQAFWLEPIPPGIDCPDSVSSKS